MKVNKLRGANKKKPLVLVKFLMTSYVPKRFASKQNHRINEGHKNLYKQTKLTKFWRILFSPLPKAYFPR